MKSALLIIMALIMGVFVFSYGMAIEKTTDRQEKAINTVMAAILLFLTIALSATAGGMW